MRINFKLLEQNGFTVDTRKDEICIYPHETNGVLFDKMREMIQNRDLGLTPKKASQLASDFVSRIQHEQIMAICEE